MDTLLVVSMGLLPLAMISFVFGASTYSSLPGSKADVSVLGEGELLMPEYDAKEGGMFQSNHRAAAELAQAANHSYWSESGLKYASQALMQAVECYEAIREQANSAVVELNLVILAKARLKVERKLGENSHFIKELEEYLDNTLAWAGWLLSEEPDRYDVEVKARYNKLKAAQDVRE